MKVPQTLDFTGFFNRLFALSGTRVFLDFNAVIVNLSLLDDSSAKECIANIKNSIENTKTQISEQLSMPNDRSFLGQAILEQQSMLLDALETWEKDFEQQLSDHQSSNKEN
ncbi:MAG: hypothetical protein K2I96_00630 [Lachnospiraceae bacterium]|nr:hypothetical protein [Lachnospiraceae bacterium]